MESNTEVILALLKQCRLLFSSLNDNELYTALLNDLLEWLKCCNEFRKIALNHFTTELNWQQDDDYNGFFTLNPSSQQILDALEYLEKLLLSKLEEDNKKRKQMEELDAAIARSPYEEELKESSQTNTALSKPDAQLREIRKQKHQQWQQNNNTKKELEEKLNVPMNGLADSPGHREKLLSPHTLKSDETKSSAVSFPLKASLHSFGNMLQYEVFICHAGEQYVLASAIYNKLFAGGIRAFLDCKSFHPGQPLQGLFDDFLQLVSCAAVIILSQDFHSSEWTLKELEILKQKAKEQHFIIVVIRTIQTDKVDATIKELEALFGRRLVIIDNIDNDKDINETALSTREVLKKMVPHNIIPCRRLGCKLLAEVGYWILNREEKKKYQRVAICPRYHREPEPWGETPSLFTYDEMIRKYHTEEPNKSFSPYLPFQDSKGKRELQCNRNSEEEEIPVNWSVEELITWLWNAKTNKRCQTIRTSKWVLKNGSKRLLALVTAARNATSITENKSVVKTLKGIQKEGIPKNVQKNFFKALRKNIQVHKELEQIIPKEIQQSIAKQIIPKEIQNIPKDIQESIHKQTMLLPGSQEIRDICSVLELVVKFCVEQQSAPSEESAIKYWEVPMDLYKLEQERVHTFQSDFLIIHNPEQHIATKLKTHLQELGFDVDTLQELRFDVDTSLTNVHKAAAVVLILFDASYTKLPLELLHKIDQAQLKPTLLKPQLIIPLFGPGASIGSECGKKIQAQFPQLFNIAGVDFRGKGAENETHDEFARRSLEFLLRLMRFSVPLRYNYWTNTTFKCAKCKRRLKHSGEMVLVFDGSGNMPVPKFQAQLICNQDGVGVSAAPETNPDVAMSNLMCKIEELL